MRSSTLMRGNSHAAPPPALQARWAAACRGSPPCPTSSATQRTAVATPPATTTPIGCPPTSPFPPAWSPSRGPSWRHTSAGGRDAAPNTFTHTHTLMASFRWRFWPRRVKPRRVDSRFHDQLKRAELFRAAPKTNHLRSRAKVRRPASKRVAVTSDGLCYRSVMIQRSVIVIAIVNGTKAGAAFKRHGLKISGYQLKFKM